MNRLRSKTAFALTAAAAGLSLALGVHSASAAPVTWVGDVDNNWSTDSGPGDTNWSGDVLPGAVDTAIFEDAPLGVSTTVDVATNIQFLQINQSTTTATNKITLGANLTINTNSTAASGINYGSTISNAAMFEMDLNGNFLNFSSNNGTGVNINLYGTYTLDTAGSQIGNGRAYGTANDDILTINIGSGSNLAVVNVSADATIGALRTATTTSNQNDTSNINIGAGSAVNVSNGALLNFLYSGRSDGATILSVNNAGAITIDSSSTLSVEYNQINNSNRTVNIGLTNQATGVVNHNGTVKMDLHERGTATISNAGTWRAAAGAIIQGEVDSAGTGDGGSVVFTNQSTGVLTNASNGSLDYNPLTSATYLNQVLTITNEGIISPGNQHNGSGLASVGTFTMTDIDVVFSGTDATLRIDLGGTAGGTFDVLTLTNGALTLDADSNLELYYVNGFNGSAGDSWTILNYGNVTGEFDLASNLTILGGSGVAADAANYSITYNSTDAVLTLIPEPASLALMGLGGLLMLSRQRKA